MSTFTDSKGLLWVRSGVLASCTDGRLIAIAPEMTDAYILSVIEAPIVPQVVTMRQARLALNAAGKLATVQAVIDSMPEPQKTNTQIWWDHSSAVERSQPLVQQLGAAIGLDSAGIDNLFIEAEKL